MKRIIVCVVLVACTGSPDEGQTEQAETDQVVFGAWCEWGGLNVGLFQRVATDCQSEVVGSVTVSCETRGYYYYSCSYDSQCPSGTWGVAISTDQPTRVQQDVVSEPWNVTLNGDYSCDTVDRTEVCNQSTGNRAPDSTLAKPDDFWMRIACMDPGTCTGVYDANVNCTVADDRCEAGFTANPNLNWEPLPRGSGIDPPPRGPRPGDSCNCVCTQ